MPRLVFISDTHGLHNQVSVPDGDILVHAGDFMNSGKDPWEAWHFAKWWNNLPHKHKILTGGNHDIYLQLCPKEVLAYLENTVYLEDSGAEIEGLKFYGSPWTPEFMDWAFMYPRGEGRRHWDLIPEGVDVLITHGPPWGWLDQITPNGEHLGCEDLWHAVDRIKPKVHCFGHIHFGFGYKETGSTKFLNVSQVNEQYKVVHKPIVIDI